MKSLKIARIFTLLLPVQILFIIILSRYPHFIEKYYSNGVYPAVSLVFRKVFGWLPISVGDIYYTLLGLFFMYALYRFFKNGFFNNIKKKLWYFGAFISIFHFLFYFLWGLNYHRSSLFESLALTKKEYTKSELVALSEELLTSARAIHQQITLHDTLEVVIEHDKKTIIKKALLGYDALAKKMPPFEYTSPSLKKSLYSLPLTYMGFSGYFNPFSGEAQVDYLVPKINLPTIATHEIAHQLGYASESEANFIGFLAAVNHQEKYYQYAGYVKALRYAVAATYGKDSIAGKRLIDSIPIGIKKNILESQNFWRSYQNKAEPFFKLFYDNYLRVNQQQDGIKGYSNMVGLLIAYREKFEFEFS